MHREIKKKKTNNIHTIFRFIVPKQEWNFHNFSLSSLVHFAVRKRVEGGPKGGRRRRKKKERRNDRYCSSNSKRWGSNIQPVVRGCFERKTKEGRNTRGKIFSKLVKRAITGKYGGERLTSLLVRVFGNRNRSIDRSIDGIEMDGPIISFINVHRKLRIPC